MAGFQRGAGGPSSDLTGFDRILAKGPPEFFFLPPLPSASAHSSGRPEFFSWVRPCRRPAVRNFLFFPRTSRVHGRRSPRRIFLVVADWVMSGLRGLRQPIGRSGGQKVPQKFRQSAPLSGHSSPSRQPVANGLSLGNFVGAKLRFGSAYQIRGTTRNSMPMGCFPKQPLPE